MTNEERSEWEGLVSTILLRLIQHAAVTNYSIVINLDLMPIIEAAAEREKP